MRQLALAGGGIACLAAYMTSADVRERAPACRCSDNVLVDDRQPVSAVFYQSASMAGTGESFPGFSRWTVGALMRPTYASGFRISTF